MPLVGAILRRRHFEHQRGQPQPGHEPAQLILRAVSQQVELVVVDHQLDRARVEEGRGGLEDLVRSRGAYRLGRVPVVRRVILEDHLQSVLRSLSTPALPAARRHVGAGVHELDGPYPKLAGQGDRRLDGAVAVGGEEIGMVEVGGHPIAVIGGDLAFQPCPRRVDDLRGKQLHVVEPRSGDFEEVGQLGQAQMFAIAGRLVPAHVLQPRLPQRTPLDEPGHRKDLIDRVRHRSPH